LRLLHEAMRLWIRKLEQITINVEASLGLWWLLTKIKADGGLRLAAIDVDTRELLMGFIKEESTLKSSRVLEDTQTGQLSLSTG